uniref:Myosin motor domain-containing protein n=1 Tax=Strigamia maritima TaxID=126957 RepID=T1JHV8_STRMM
MGVLDLLDEECKMPKGSDATWVQKLYDKCNKSKHFMKPRLSNTAFIVCHFADKVQYECYGFLGKNRDTVMEEQINILKASHYELVADLFMDSDKSSFLTPKTIVKVTPAAKAGSGSAKQHKQTVGSQFRASLTLLMTTLNSTTPHYVRCIKPNDEKSSFKFEPKRAVQQLRACGVLETIRISAAGFPSRWPYQDFFSRYRVLITSKDIKRTDMKTTSEKILQNIIKDDDKFKFGKTKIFFRAGQVAYLEKLRADRLRSCCIMIQKRVKGWVQQKKYRLIQNCVLRIQTRIRGYQARKQAKFIRETRAATRIQKLVRGFVQRRKYVAICRSVLAVQRFARGKWARIRFENLRRYCMAVIIQKWIRGWLARRAFKKNVAHIVFLQSCVRRKIARKEFKRLKVEARSVEHIKKLNKGLENKIISMQQKNGELVKEINSLKASVQDTQALTVEINELRGKERVSKEASNKIAQLEEELAVLRQTLEKEIGEKVDLINEKDYLESKQREMEKAFNEENNRLTQELKSVTELQQKMKKEAEDSVKQRIDDESKMLLDEFNSERGAHQKLLKDYARLEQRFDNLQNELNRVRGEPTHSRNPSNVSTLSIHTDTTETIGDELPDDDIGYGSVHSQDRRSKLDRGDWDQVSPKDYSPDSDKKGQVTKLEDVSLVLKLQQKLKEVESAKLRLEKKLESIENDSPKDEAKRAQEQIRLQELEMENAKQKGDLKTLRAAAAKGSDNEELIG